MLRLTLRSRDDARFLARIIDRDGFVFVLDYGDPPMVADATERVTRGFSMWRTGKLETVGPASPDLLTLLAEFYAQEGLDVALEDGSGAPHPTAEGAPPEPLVPGASPRTATGRTALDAHLGELGHPGALDEPPSEETELVGLADGIAPGDEETELATMSEIPDVGDALETWTGPKPTNPGALRKRALWRPPGTPTPRPMAPRPRRPKAQPEPEPVARTDEEETELVPSSMRRAALADEDHTELQSGPAESAAAEEDA